MTESVTDLDRYGPWAVIAGGSEGVGAEFAREFACSGINLVLVARKPGPLASTAEAVRALGVEVRTVATDLTSPVAMDQITDATADLEVGLLVYNAGANTHGRAFTRGTLDGFASVIDLNISAMLALVHHYAVPMRERGRGGILLVGSLAGYVGTSTEGVYGGAKAFGRIFAEGLWAELREHGVDVLELVLGVTRTPAMVRAGLNFDVPGMHVLGAGQTSPARAWPRSPTARCTWSAATRRSSRCARPPTAGGSWPGPRRSCGFWSRTTEAPRRAHPGRRNSRLDDEVSSSRREFCRPRAGVSPAGR